jgi:hypothetical protein
MWGFITSGETNTYSEKLELFLKIFILGGFFLRLKTFTHSRRSLNFTYILSSAFFGNWFDDFSPTVPFLHINSYY